MTTSKSRATSVSSDISFGKINLKEVFQLYLFLTNTQANPTHISLGKTLLAL